ncbi:Signal transduction protein [Candidatus Terasakiella magnetica]|nr:Signal transduction protein [Candidatus Terasakiella magnetica]
MNDQTALFDALLDSIRDAVVIADTQGHVVRISRACEVMLGGSALSDKLDALVKRAMAPGNGGRGQGLVRCGDGRERPFEIVLSAVNGEAAFPSHYFGLVRPAAVEVEASGQELVRFGYDSLTGLPGRELFVDRVDQAILQASRLGSSVALMMMGLDRFTLVNDALGHGAGDRLLIEVARRLKMCVRETDTAVRLDGDKFALAMVIADMDDSVIVAEKVLNSVKVPFALDGQEVVVTFSIGISVFPMDADSSAQQIKHSEHALHYAKISGRNQYQFFSKDMNRKAKSRLELETRMRRALTNDEFVVYYQPKVSADHGTIVGAEALIRWIDPERGLISPAEFIPVAEETGQIEAIGSWVLWKSCQQNKQWQEDGLTPLKVSVNVSARQFRSRVLVDTVLDVLERTGLDPKWLELEITESMLMNDVDTAVRKMTALRELGIGLSIDDFGTGYSSLSYLGRFPITTLKIDRAFIADVDTNPKTAEIARAIIGLSRGLNLEVVAEGAEVAGHIQFLRDHCCDTVQGFYYSRPVPADEFEKLLRQGVLVHI